jgi:paraquat-inducible protein B
MEKNNPSVPEAKVVVKKRGRFSFVWIIPIVAAVVGAWIGINTIRNQGPTITIIFKSADGLEANKTTIKYNGVAVGEITSVRLTDNYQSVIATAKMSPKTEEFLLKDTKFWVVKPQISGANISGLSTIISGAYLGMEIGKSKATERHFTALDEAPAEAGGITGHFFTLKTPQLGSIGKGTPVYYRRLQAGEVESYELDKGGKFLNVKIFVQAPYDRYVTTDTRFWQASGVNVSLSASGLQVHTESLLSILVGGIAFETPEASLALPPAESGTLFALNKNREEAFRPPAYDPQTFVLTFKESLRGLTVGAPVELSGIAIGEVTAIHAQFDQDIQEFTAPVTIEVDPARYGVDFFSLDGVTTSEEIRAAHMKTIENFVARGMRAQLKTGSLVTGSRYVSLEFFPNAEPVKLDWSQQPLQFPTQPGSLESIEASVTEIVKKLNQVPFKEIGENLNTTITNSGQLMKNASQLVSPDSMFGAQLNGTLQQVGGAAQALRVLADYLERHPEAILHGKSGDAK